MDIDDAVRIAEGIAGIEPRFVVADLDFALRIAEGIVDVDADASVRWERRVRLQHLAPPRDPVRGLRRGPRIVGAGRQRRDLRLRARTEVHVVLSTARGESAIATTRTRAKATEDRGAYRVTKLRTDVKRGAAHSDGCGLRVAGNLVRVRRHADQILAVRPGQAAVAVVNTCGRAGALPGPENAVFCC